jgi:hypothetical protein
LPKWKRPRRRLFQHHVSTTFSGVIN